MIKEPGSEIKTIEELILFFTKEIASEIRIESNTLGIDKGTELLIGYHAIELAEAMLERRKKFAAVHSFVSCQEGHF